MSGWLDNDGDTIYVCLICLEHFLFGKITYTNTFNTYVQILE